MTTLDGRVARLETAVAAGIPDLCRGCGLAHARPPIPLATVEAMVRSGRASGAEPVPRLCLCDPCCGSPQGRMIARLSHGLSLAEDVPCRH